MNKPIFLRSISILHLVLLFHVFSFSQPVITYVHSQGIGSIAVKITLPENPRFQSGAPIVMSTANWFAGTTGFHEVLNPAEIGAISVSYLWPGNKDHISGAQSDGVFDHCGPLCMAAYRDVIRFVCGDIPNKDGYYMDQLIDVLPLYDNVGIYAFSHSGVAATNVLAYHGQDLSKVKYFVGRENPTIDQLYPLEPGHFNGQRNPVDNPCYNPSGYTRTTLDIDYSKVRWIQNISFPEGRPFFDVPGQDYVLAETHPKMWGKDYYSAALLQALLDNGTLSLITWPQNLATPQEAQANWPYRTTVNNYQYLETKLPQLKIMLVFASDDHVQSAPDKPHIRQAYDGFYKVARLWVRLNPDRSYVEALTNAPEAAAYSENAANSEPSDWMNARTWGYGGPYGSKYVTHDVPLAALAEMIDRVYTNTWTDDLQRILPIYKKKGKIRR